MTESVQSIARETPRFDWFCTATLFSKPGEAPEDPSIAQHVDIQSCEFALLLTTAASPTRRLYCPIFLGSGGRVPWSVLTRSRHLPYETTWETGRHREAVGWIVSSPEIRFGSQKPRPMGGLGKFMTGQSHGVARQIAESFLANETRRGNMQFVV
jgi:hypothetical protein